PPLLPVTARSSNWCRRDSDRRIAAVDQQVAAGHEARRVAGEKDRGSGDLLRPAKPAGEVLGADLLLRSGKGAVALQRPLGLDRAGRQRIDPDILRGVVD